MFIYKITNTINGKVYIGLTTNSLKTRFKQHCDEARKGRSGRPICQAIKKYGRSAFAIEQLDTAKDLEELKALERHYIAEYDSLAEKGKGYNLSLGGEGTAGLKRSEAFKQHLRERQTGAKHSPEVRKRLSEIALIQKEELIKRMTDGTRRAWADPEKRQRMIEQRRGRKWTEEQRAKSIAARTAKKRGPTAHTRKMAEIMAVMCGPLHRTKLVRRGKKERCYYCEKRAEAAYRARKRIRATLQQAST